MTVRDAERTVGQLVVERPGRAQFFDQLGIDYGYGGGTSLARACAGSGLDVRAVLRGLETCDLQDGVPANAEWEPASLGALIDRIVAVHHGHLRRELPRLERLVRQVVQAHGDRYPELAALREAVAGLKDEMERHMLKEEWVVFPCIRRLEAATTAREIPDGLDVLIANVGADHAETAEALARIRSLADGYRTPADACPAHRALLGGLAGLEADLHHHVHEEAQLLFPRALALAAALRARG